MASGRDILYNIITAFMVLLTFIAIASFGGLSVLLPEQTPAAVLEPTPFVLSTATPTLVGPTVGPTQEASPTPTSTQNSVVTLTPTITPTITPTLSAEEVAATESARATADFDPTETPTPPLYEVEDDVVEYDANPDADAGCDVSVISGDVQDEDGDGISGLEVRLTGDELDRTETTGDEPRYGDGGWEFVLADGPRDEVVFVQLFDEDGNPVSRLIGVELIDDCDVNRAFVLFVAVEG